MASQTMKGVVLYEDGNVAVKEDIPMPIPASGEVLIRIEYAPINPSDLIFIKNWQKSIKKLPCIPGWEGAGTVIQSGGGIMAWTLVGKRVGFVNTKGDFYGSWGQFIVVPAFACIKLPQQVDFQKGCNCIVNPLTCLAMLDLVLNTKKKDGSKHRTIISTAACSQLGRMMIRVFRQNNIRVINIVRRQEQIDILKNEENAEIVLNSSDPQFQEQLTKCSEEFRPSVAFEAIGGEMTNTIMNATVRGGVVYLYGMLSFQPAQFESTKIIFSGVRLEGLLLNNWIKEKNLWNQWKWTSKLQNMLANVLTSQISKSYDINDYRAAIQDYESNMTKGKVLLKMHP